MKKLLCLMLMTSGCFASQPNLDNSAQQLINHTQCQYLTPKIQRDPIQALQNLIQQKDDPYRCAGCLLLCSPQCWAIDCC